MTPSDLKRALSSARRPAHARCAGGGRAGPARARARSVEHDRVRAIADRVDDELKAGGVGVEDRLLQRGRRLEQEPARGGIVGIRLEERGRARAHRPIREELQAADAQPVVAEPGHHAGVAQAADTVVLNRRDARGQLARCAQRLVGPQLRGARRHVLDRRDAERRGMLERRARLDHRASSDSAGIARVTRSMALSLSIPAGHRSPRARSAAIGRLRQRGDARQRHGEGVGDAHVTVEPLDEHRMVGVTASISRRVGSAARPRLVVPVAADDPPPDGRVAA